MILSFSTKKQLCRHLKLMYSNRINQKDIPRFASDFILKIWLFWTTQITKQLEETTQVQRYCTSELLWRTWKWDPGGGLRSSLFSTVAVLLWQHASAGPQTLLPGHLYKKISVSLVKRDKRVRMWCLQMLMQILHFQKGKTREIALNLSI